MVVQSEALEVTDSVRTCAWRDRLNHHSWLGHFTILISTIAIVYGLLKSKLIYYIYIWIGMLLIRLLSSVNYWSLLQVAGWCTVAGILIIPQIIFYSIRRRKNKLLFSTVLLVEYLIVAAVLHGVYCQESMRCAGTFRNASMSHEELIQKCGAPLYYQRDGLSGVYTDGTSASMMWVKDDNTVQIGPYGSGCWPD